jgi:type IX secretion system PorP/SprF family membrane protein
MNRVSLGIFILLFPVHLYGQMFPLSDHYINNPLSINPAYAGCDDALSATILYRNQWVGFTDAPKTYMLSIHTPLNNDRMGLGLHIENNSIGIFKETSFMGNYAYRRELYNGRIALGLGFGLTAYHNDWDDLDAVDADDALLTNNPASAVLPAFSLGTYYYTKKYFIGISLPLFLSHDLDQNTGEYKIRNNFSDYNYFFTGGYELGIGSRTSLLPALLIKYHPNNAIQIDISTQINIKNRIWMGIGYRSKNMIFGMLQCQLNDQLRMAYSYDFDLSPTGKYKNGSHEILLKYVFSYERKVAGPRQF